jgi:hypothetical protein
MDKAHNDERPDVHRDSAAKRNQEKHVNRFERKANKSGGMGLPTVPSDIFEMDFLTPFSGGATPRALSV